VEIRGTFEKKNEPAEELATILKRRVVQTDKGKYLERRKADQKRGWWWITQLEKCFAPAMI
jgi:hypothetical protein